MSAGSTDGARLALIATWVAWLGGCDARASDPPPPSASHEITPAPPGARGARAAGTDAEPAAPEAPKDPGGELDWGEPPSPTPESAPDAGADAGGSEPEGVPL